MSLLLETSWEFEASSIHLRKLLSQRHSCQICHRANEVINEFNSTEQARPPERATPALH